MKKNAFLSEVACENSKLKNKIQAKRLKNGFNIITVYHENNKKSILIENYNLIYNSILKQKEITNLLKNKIKSFIKCYHLKEINALIVGLGNKQINCDSLGPKTCSKILNTSLSKNTKLNLTSSVSTICPDVMGKTGIDTIKIVDAISKISNSNLIILIDSLSTNETKRIGNSIQISSLGLTPGSGSNFYIQDKKSSKNLIVPTISIGIPLVSFIFNKNDSFKNLIITPKDINFLTDYFSDIISNSINLALHDGLTLSQLKTYNALLK